MRKWLLVAVVPLAGLALACATLLFWPRPARFTSDMAARIRPGMTEAEVAALLGRPAGNYAGSRKAFSTGTWYVPDDSGVLVESHSSNGWQRTSGPTVRRWASDEANVWVELDADGRVAHFAWEPLVVLAEESPLDFLRRLTHRLLG